MGKKRSAILTNSFVIPNFIREQAMVEYSDFYLYAKEHLDEINILNFYGERGCGKSTLIEELYKRPEGIKICIDYKDHSEDTQPMIYFLKNMVNLLINCNSGFKFPFFSLGLLRYAIISGEMDKDAAAKFKKEQTAFSSKNKLMNLTANYNMELEDANDLWETVAKFLLNEENLADMPFFSSFVKCYRLFTRGYDMVSQLKIKSDPKYKEIINILSSVNKHNLEDGYLTYLLNLDLKNRNNENGELIVVFVDSFELIDTATKKKSLNWLLGDSNNNTEILIKGNKGILNDLENIAWVMVSENKINWDGWEEDIQYHYLGPFNKDDVISLCNKVGINDDYTISKLYQASEGNPAAVKKIITNYFQCGRDTGNTDYIKDAMSKLAVSYFNELCDGEQLLLSKLTALGRVQENDRDIFQVLGDGSRQSIVELEKGPFFISKRGIDYSVSDWLLPFLESRITRENNNIKFDLYEFMKCMVTYYLDKISASMYKGKALYIALDNLFNLIEICGSDSMDWERISLIQQGIECLSEGFYCQDAVELSEKCRDSILNSPQFRNLPSHEVEKYMETYTLTYVDALGNVKRTKEALNAAREGFQRWNNLKYREEYMGYPLCYALALYFNHQDEDADIVFQDSIEYINKNFDKDDIRWIKYQGRCAFYMCAVKDYNSAFNFFNEIWENAINKKFTEEHYKWLIKYGYFLLKFHNHHQQALEVAEQLYSEIQNFKSSNHFLPAALLYTLCLDAFNRSDKADYIWEIIFENVGKYYGVDDHYMYYLKMAYIERQKRINAGADLESEITELYKLYNASIAWDNEELARLSLNAGYHYIELCCEKRNKGEAESVFKSYINKIEECNYQLSADDILKWLSNDKLSQLDIGCDWSSLLQKHINKKNIFFIPKQNSVEETDNQFKKAVEAFQSGDEKLALGTVKKIFGRSEGNKPDENSDLANIIYADNLIKQNRNKEAIKIYDKILDHIKNGSFMVDAKIKSAIFSSYGVALDNLGDKSKVPFYMKEAYDLLKTVDSVSEIRKVEALANYGLSLKKAGDKACIAIYAQIYEELNQLFDKNNKKSYGALSDYGDVLEQFGYDDRALEISRRVYELLKNTKNYGAYVAALDKYHKRLVSTKDFRQDLALMLDARKKFSRIKHIDKKYKKLVDNLLESSQKIIDEYKQQGIMLN